MVVSFLGFGSLVSETGTGQFKNRGVMDQAIYRGGGRHRVFEYSVRLRSLAFKNFLLVVAMFVRTRTR
jgi:hypothetical protein